MELSAWENLSRVEGIGVISDKNEGRLIISKAKIKGFSDKKKIYLYTKDKHKIGKEIYFRGKVIPREESMNPGSFNEKLYDLSSGISIRLEANQISETGASSWLYSLKATILEEVDKRIRSYLLDEPGEIMGAMLLGSEISKESLKDFQDLGLIHILSISGLHIGILLFVMEKILEPFSMSLYLRKMIKHVVTLGFIFIVGFPIGALRVYLMLFFVDLAKVLQKPIEGEYALYFASFIFQLINPFVIFNYSFLFSFISIWAIFKVHPVLINCLPVKNKYIRESLSLSLSVNLAILPLVLSLQGRLSLLGIILNIVLIPVFSLIMVMTIFLLFSSFIWAGLAAATGLSINGLLGICLYIIKVSTQVPAYLTMSPFHFFGAILYYGMILIWVRGLYNIFPYKFAQICIYQGLIIICLMVIFCKTSQPDLRITQIYVGQGDAALIEIGSYRALIDTGGSNFANDPGARYTLSFLKNRGIRKIDDLFISHFDSDHIEGIFSLSPEVKIRNIYASYVPKDREYYDRIEKEIGKINQVSSFSKRFKNARISLIQHSGSREDENENSLVLLLDNGYYSFLSLGDLPVLKEKEIGPKIKRANIIKLGHHGSKTSTSETMLDELSPNLAIVSAGIGNSYGHPHKEVLDRLHEKKIKCLRTDRSGAIQISMEGPRIEVREYVKGEKISFRKIGFISVYLMSLGGLGWIMSKFFVAGERDEGKGIY